LEDGRTGAGWVRFRCFQEKIYREDQGLYYLGKEMEVYEAELYAMEEALLNSLTTLNDTKHIYICIDNQAAIQALQHNKDNGEACCKAIYYAPILRIQGTKTKTI
jgi:hypothetical protein